MSPIGDDTRRLILGAAIGVVAFLAVQSVLGLTGVWPGLDGRFGGPDDYMRLSRILECRGGLACPEGVYPRSNAPHGEVLHWPFLGDWIVLALAVPLVPLVGWPSAVTLAGHVIGPLLGVVAVALVVRIAVRLMDGAGVLFAGLLVASQVWFLNAFGPQSPDHHGLQILLFLGAVAGALPLLQGRYRRRAAVAAGSMIGLAVWVSVEGFVSGLPILAAVWLAWVLSGEPHAARANRDLWIGVLAVVTVALAVDGPRPQAFAVELDRVSVVHWLAAALLAAFWTAAARFRAGSPSRRLAFTAISAAGCAAILVALFPGVQRGPLANMDPDLMRLWLGGMVEYRGAAGGHEPVWSAVVLGLLPLALPLSAWLALGKARRLDWGLVALGLAWFGALAALRGIRWAYYLHALYPLPLAWLLGVALDATGRWRTPLARAGAHVGLVATFFLAPFVLVAAIGDESPGPCNVAPLVPSLQRLAPAGTPGAVVLAPVYWGPEILFRTGHRVVATPYHRNAAGIKDSHAVMSAGEWWEAEEVLRRRGVGLLAACRESDWHPSVPHREPGTVYHRLLDGSHPGWLVPVELPPDVADGYRLWRVELR